MRNEVGDKGEVGIWRREGDRWIDLLPWTRSDAVKPGNSTNDVDLPMASISQRQQLDKEDEINERTFNEAIWKSVKGADSTMPAPRHTLWGAVPYVEDDDD